MRIYNLFSLCGKPALHTVAAMLCVCSSDSTCSVAFWARRRGGQLLAQALHVPPHVSDGGSQAAVLLLQTLDLLGGEGARSSSMAALQLGAERGAFNTSQIMRRHATVWANDAMLHTYVGYTHRTSPFSTAAFIVFGRYPDQI